MKSLIQQIEELQDVQPKEFDAEDFENPKGLHDTESEDSESTYQAARDHYLDVGPSQLRRTILDSELSGDKYTGVQTSRELLAEDIDSNHSSPDVEGDGVTASPQHFNVSHTAADYGDQEEDHQHRGSLPRLESRQSHDLPGVQDLTFALHESRTADREKGKTIVKQTWLWDSIIDARIKMQKAVGNANLLPNPSVAQEVPENTSQLLCTVLQAGLELSEELFSLEEARAGAEGITPSRKRRKLDDGAGRTSPQTLTQDLTFMAEAFASLEAAFHQCQVQTLQKWSTKVQSVTPSALLPSRRTSFRPQNIAPKSVVELIAEMLDEGGAGRAKAVGRTRVRRGQVQPRLSLNDKGDVSFGPSIEGEVALPEGDAEVFDDTDFYQEVLRDVIHAKSGNINADESEATQRKTMKKVVETKASKGRKLRYEIHEKLQNFMVPVPVRGTWHDEQIDELFASFMGKSPPSEEAPGTAAVALDGLRVF